MQNNVHNCNNITCRLLNPSLERLLEYEDLAKRVAKAEEMFFDDIKYIDKLKSLKSLKSFPLGLFGWCDQHHVWQLLNKEFVQELAKEIKNICPDIIIEVGAGQGLLGKYLSKELNREVIITDDGSWWERDEINIENNGVIKIDYKEAIRSYSPDLIIASWIPYQRWWTRYFQECKSVKGYILIGEGPGGCTGSDMDWNTNWIMNGLDNVDAYGICRSDHGFYRRGYLMRHTNVTYFERS